MGLKKYVEKAKSLYPTATEDNALILYIKLLEHRDSERIELLKLNASQASKIASLQKDK